MRLRLKLKNKRRKDIALSKKGRPCKGLSGASKRCETRKERGTRGWLRNQTRTRAARRLGSWVEILIARGRERDGKERDLQGMARSRVTRTRELGLLKPRLSTGSAVVSRLRAQGHSLSDSGGCARTTNVRLLKQKKRLGEWAESSES